MPERLISLLTSGDGTEVTGGHLFNQRMAAAAPSHDSAIEFVPVSGLSDPRRRARGHILVDSLVAGAVAPWVLVRGDAPISALVHQVPGGVDQGPVGGPLRRRLDLALYRRCSFLIAVSEALRVELVTRHGIPAQRVRVVEPGSDLPIDHSGVVDLRRGRRIALLTVGNWMPNKGIVELLDAVVPLAPDQVSVHLVGRADLDRGYTAGILARLADPALAGRVVVHGVLDEVDLGRLYGHADVFALPSRNEAYGTVFGEALSAGLPVLGWRSGNLPNLIHDRREGFLVSPGDVPGLSRAIDRLAGDEQLRMAMAANALVKGRTLPTWSDAADAFFGAFDEAFSSP